MTAILNNEGRIDALGVLLSGLGSSLKVMLFAAPAATVVTDVLATYTEATFAGYARVAPTWTSVGIDGNGNEQANGTACVFTSTGPTPSNIIYGYCLIDAGGGKVLFSEVFSAPLTINASGQSITVTPTLYLGNLTPPY